MTSEQFCYWLQGRMEMLPNQLPTQAEWKMIQEHLATVFNKVTPPLSTPLNPFPYNPKPFMPTVPFNPLTDDRMVVTC